MKMVQFKIVEITNLDGFLLEFEKVPYYSKFFFKDELEAIYSYLSDYEMDTGYNVLLSPETIYRTRLCAVRALTDKTKKNERT